MKYGVTSLFYGFLAELKKRKSHIAPLQITGKLEDYLCKEFSAHIHKESHGNRIALSNVGTKGQRKYDIAIISQANEIKAILEAKYIGNRHRNTEFLAEDNISTTIKKLAEQCIPPSLAVHGYNELKLNARSNTVYGLVFSGFTSMNTPREYKLEKRNFYKKCLDAGHRNKFRYHDLKVPFLRPAFEDVKFISLGNRWYASLKVGLWRTN